jgi:hypothetical protein
MVGLRARRWDAKKSVLEGVHPNPEIAQDRLVSLSVNSPRDMMLPYNKLSAGLQHRVALARGLSPNACFDDFAAPLETATGRVRSVAAGLAAAARCAGYRITIATGRPVAVLPWLLPDWVYFTERRLAYVRHTAPGGGHQYLCYKPSTADGGLQFCRSDDHAHDLAIIPPTRPHTVEWASGGGGEEEVVAGARWPPSAPAPSPWRLREGVPPMLRPSAQQGDGAWNDGSLRIVLQRGRTVDWKLFQREHYKQGPLHGGAACFVARLPAHGWEVVGFVAALQHPGSKGAKHFREHRVCVMEKWQGIGIGCAITGAELCALPTTAHPPPSCHCSTAITFKPPLLFCPT